MGSTWVAMAAPVDDQAIGKGFDNGVDVVAAMLVISSMSGTREGHIEADARL